MSNKANGNSFERDLATTLSACGFWAHLMNQNKNGQPADVIAVKDQQAYLIDCKDCENDMFLLSRVEANQETAMRKWELCGNNQGLFALKTSKGVYMVRYGILDTWEVIHGKKSLNLKDIVGVGYELSNWVKVARQK